MVQLISTDPHAQSPQEYIALSHCWGGNTLQLTRDTQKELTTPFASSLLPKNFRDAVIFTRDLGYSYVWIDSLCILQDSFEDKMTEIMAMSAIYSGAVCTLAATASADSEGGCFRARNPAQYSNCPLVNTFGASCWLPARTHVQIMDIEQVFANQVDTAPLSRRAWTFQERMLSRRVIHFCENIVLFECNAMAASEWHQEGVPYPRNQYIRFDGRLYTGEEVQVFQANHPEYVKEPYTHRVRYLGSARTQLVRGNSWAPNPEIETTQRERQRLVDSSARSGIRGALEMLQTLPNDLSQAEKLECHRRWYELVSAYSGREMTYRIDRIRALAGIIELISKKTNMINVAGLWETTLAFDLLWAPTNCQRLPPGPPVAPSWSWASVSGQVDSLLTSFRGAHEEVDEETRGGVIHIKTITTCTATHQSPDDSSLEAPKLSACDICLSIHGKLAQVDLQQIPWTKDSKDFSTTDRAFALLVFSEVSSMDHGYLKYRWAGLILRAVRSADAFDSVYERIGSVVSEDSPDAWLFEGQEARTIILN